MSKTLVGGIKLSVNTFTSPAMSGSTACLAVAVQTQHSGPCVRAPSAKQILISGV